MPERGRSEVLFELPGWAFDVRRTQRRKADLRALLKAAAPRLVGVADLATAARIMAETERSLFGRRRSGGRKPLPAEERKARARESRRRWKARRSSARLARDREYHRIQERARVAKLSPARRAQYRQRHNEAARAHKQRRRQALRAGRVCSVCAGSIEDRTLKAMYCSGACKTKAYLARQLKGLGKEGA